MNYIRIEIAIEAIDAARNGDHYGDQVADKAIETIRSLPAITVSAGGKSSISALEHICFLLEEEGTSHDRFTASQIRRCIPDLQKCVDELSPTTQPNAAAPR